MFLFLIFSLAFCADIVPLDLDWKFNFTHAPQPSFSTCSVAECKNSYDDSAWTSISIPHDFVVLGTFTKSADMSHGYLPFGKGWYRRKFTYSGPARKAFLHFEGTQRNAVVFFNEQFLGNHLSGYTPHSYDVSAFLKPLNVISVYIDATQPDSWWYDGGGIYRHVYLRYSNESYISPLSVYVPCKLTSEPKIVDSVLVASATAHIEVSINNDNIRSAFEGSISYHINNYTVSQPVSLKAPGSASFSTNINLVNIPLWGIDHPTLQTLRIDLLDSQKNLVDSFTQTFGVRSIHWDPNTGFHLNSQPVKIKGFANHQDFAGVGVAVPDSLQAFRVSKLKSMGANAWRTAHNPPNVALLDECDKQGFLVWDENHRNLAEGGQWVSDLTSLIMRDRNHPSVIMWSLCNEVLCEGFNATSAKFLKTVVQALDPLGGRPVSAAMNGGYGTAFSDLLDVMGFNYHTNMYESYHQSHPKQPMIGSETSSAFTDRAIYVTSSVDKTVSSYDVNFPGWGESAQVGMKAGWLNDFVSGQFVWTGYDYKGEPTPYSWPNVNSHFGVIDIAGFPKDPFYYYQSIFVPETPLVHLFPHWNWQQGKNVNLWVYSNAAEVELFVNGKSLGKKSMTTEKSPMGRVYKTHVEWDVMFEPGVIVAVGYNEKGDKIASDSRTTAGKADKVSLSVEFPSHGSLKSNGVDVGLITCRVVDAQGNLVPIAGNLVKFSVVGAGEIIGLGNGNPNCHEADKPKTPEYGERSVFGGLARLVIQSTTKRGVIKIKAESDELLSDQITVQVV